MYTAPLPIRAAPAAEPRRAASRAISTRALAGGRVSLDRHGDPLGALQTVAPPPDAEGHWHLENLDNRTLTRMSAAKLMELLADLSPEVSKALWDFLLFVNPGYVINAYKPGTEEVDTAAQAALDSFITQLGRQHGSFNALLGRIILCVPLRGAYASELILDKRGRMPLDLATPDPTSFRFKKMPDELYPERGLVWTLGQQQGAKWVRLDRETIRYIPIISFPGGAPYGRPLFSAALFSALFLLGMLHDLRRVVMQQGYPRLDIAVDFEALAGKMPNPEDEEEFQAWAKRCEDAIKDVEDRYAALEPDDAYVHDTGIEIKSPKGVIDAFSLAGASQLITALERMCTRALKTTGIMLNLDTTASESWANRQYEVFVAGIKIVQHSLEEMLEHQFGLALQVQGFAATVSVRFHELRTAELLRDAQVEALNGENAAHAYDRGWISQDEAAKRGAGQDKADVPEPRASSSAAPVGGLVGGSPDPGETRAQVLIRELRETRQTVGSLLMAGAARTNGHKELVS